MRATWHECAAELDAVSQQFRKAYWGTYSNSLPRDPRDDAEMVRTSKEGVQILRALALAVRSEQDFNLVPPIHVVVGAVKKEHARPEDAAQVKQACGYAHVLALPGYTPLHLREALNKIAHPDPRSADYFIGQGNSAHELLLYGSNRGHNWFAAVSVLRLVSAIQALPDTAMQ